ncbi:hypothetical protein D9M71_494730 [compost metagenome]
MPPAFNLSQDQTLQFNLCVEASRLPRSFERSLTLRKLTDQIRRPSHVLLCEHCITCEATPSEDSGVRYPAPTLIGCLFVKELRRPALPFSALRCLQQRNEIMQNYLRFVNRFSQLFLLQPARQLRRANLPVDPATLASAALQRRVVLRGGEY